MMDKNAPFGSLYAWDALNRPLPEVSEVGSLRKDRYVGMFYFLTHDSRPNGPCIRNLSGIMLKSPEAIYNYDHPAWGDCDKLYWDQPLFGYYPSDDRYVISKHVEMLTHAGVDFLVFDTTNRTTFFPQIEVILEVLGAHHADGFSVPKIVYYTNTKSGETIREIYDDVYAKRLHPELWFMYENKPMIIGDPHDCDEETRAFFTFRLCQWPTEDQKAGGFPWIDFTRPQAPWLDKNGQTETVSVSIAQHPNIAFGQTALYGRPGARGRSYHGYLNHANSEAIAYGYNVAEQWERARQLDPTFVFFTGLNEWTVGRIRGPKEQPILLIDQANDEFSRDIEPMRGGFFDNYYMQFCQESRRFKGAPPVISAGAKKTIDIRGGFEQWDDVPAEYFNMRSYPRDSIGVDGKTYQNHTLRNAFRRLKVARDHANIYFFAETADDITAPLPNALDWMLLYIGVVGRERKPHWHGYHYLMNQVILDSGTAFFKACLGGYRFTAGVRTEYRREGDRLHLRIPRTAMNIPDGEDFSIYFKWADHASEDPALEDFYENGDVAPFGRFSFRYDG